MSSRRFMFVLTYLVAIALVGQVTDGLVAYYPLNGNTDDESGNGNDGLEYGASLTNDRFGNENSAYNFDGLDDYINLGLEVFQPSEYSFSLWFYAHSFSGPDHILTKDMLGMNRDFSLISDGEYIGFTVDDGTNDYWILYTANIPTSTWFHVVVTYNDSIAKLYIDNELQDTIVQSGLNIVSDSADWIVGSLRGNLRFFDGKIDDIHIYDNALSTSEIDSLYHLSGWDQFTRLTGDPIVTDGISASGSSFIDYDNDGDLDLFVANGGPNNLYQNDGSGGFSEIISGAIITDNAISRGMAWGDYDNDNHIDLYVTNEGSVDNYLYTNDGDGSFTKITSGELVTDGITSYGASWADYDVDGFLDLFVANVGSNSLFNNNGDGSFTAIADNPIISSGGGMTSICGLWADYNDDGLIDLLVTGGATNLLYKNEGNGDFVSQSSIPIVTDISSSYGGAWFDCDNDGDLDLFVNNNTQPNCLYLNNGDESFTKVVSGSIVTDNAWSHSCSPADYDNDGDIDLFVANHESSDWLYVNNGDGSFNNIDYTIIGDDITHSQGSVWSDYDNDGDMDLYVSNSSSENNTLFINRGNSNTWLNIQLVGTSSSVSGIGAKIWVKANTNNSGSFWQRRDISSGSQSAYSQNSLRAAFGLGQASIIDSIRINWPGGIVWDTTNVQVNQFLTIREPAEPTETVTDIDGNVYETVQIGDQVWMAENLKVTHNRDGSTISHVTDPGVWTTTISGAYCSYSNNSSNEAETYGALYNWLAAADDRNIAPEGWHVPTDDEWKELEMTIGMSQSEADATGYRGTNEGSKLAGNSGLWDSGELEDDAEFGSSGFNALPGGARSSANGEYDGLGGNVSFWTATATISDEKWYRTLYYNRSDVWRYSVGNGKDGFAIRCIKDAITEYSGPVWNVSVDGSDETGDGSFEFPFASIQFGIDASQSGDTLLVQPGTYIENINYNGKSIVVGSMTMTTGDTSYISQTIIDGGQSGSVVTFATSEDTTTVLTGFTITNGSGTEIIILRGGGIYCRDASPRLSHLIIRNNTAYIGGGIYARESDLIISKSIIRENLAEDEGGGIYAGDIEISITESIFESNEAITTGGGLYFEGVSTGVLDEVRITNNLSDKGGGLRLNSSVANLQIIKCLIDSNYSTDNGSGIYQSSGSLSFINSTLVDNIVAGGENVGGIYHPYGYLEIQNSILWSNHGQSLYGLGTLDVDYSCVEDGGALIGEGIIDYDPQFVSGPDHNYLLTESSPCIDTGNPDLDEDGYYWAVDLDDQDEDGTRLDIGAFSFSQEDQDPGNNSLAFDGIDDYVIVPREYGPSNIGQHRTLAAWIRIEDLTPRAESSGETGEIAYASAITQQITSTYSGSHWGGIGIELSENPKFQAIGYSGPPLYTVASGITTPIIGEWYHLALVFDGNTLRLYVNGLEEGSQSFTGFYPTSTGGDAALVIGSHLANQEFNYTFPGLIDKVQLWNRALQPSELRNLISSTPSDSVDMGLVGHWSLDEGSGISISDESESEFATDGALSGGQWSNLNPTPIDYLSLHNVATSGSNESGDGSEDSPFATIQFGIEAARNGDTVLVQPGTYLENINFQGKNVTVGSLTLISEDTSYIGQTIIDGNESGSVITFSSSEDTTSILNGFTITNGSALAGGGIYCDGAIPILTNLKIFGNTASTFGGGIYSDHSSHPIVSSSLIENNVAGVGGGIQCQNNSGVTLIDVEVIGNQASENGGGINIHSGEIYATRTDFNENITLHEMSGYGGGVSLIGDVGPYSFVNCKIQGNTVANRGGGLYCDGANPTLTNVLITDNTVTNTGNYDGGSGIYNPGLGPYINVTIANNWAPNRGAIYGGSGTVFTNSIIWHNSPSISPSIVATYSNIEDNGLPGEGNLNTDPLFVDMYNQDYHLSNSSPCIGAGDSTAITAVDLEGNIRPDPAGSAPDMGAFESPLSVREAGNTYFVSSTGSDTTFGGLIDPFSTIGRGIEAAWNGDTVIVFPGVYAENLYIANMSIVLGSQLLLTGDTNYVNITKINGGITFDDGVDSAALLSGFTIQNSTTGITCQGNPNLSYLKIQDHSNNGILFNGSEASLSHITLTRNGRGIEGTDSELYFYDIVIDQNNTAGNGAGLNLIGCLAVLDSVEITDNVSTNGFGGGMYINSSTITLSRSKIERNRSDNFDGGGIYFTTNSSITMENVSVSENQANEFGGGLYIGRDINSSFLASNISITSNECNEYGAGIYIRGVNDFTLSESRIGGNAAIRRGGGIYCWDAHPELLNVLISDNAVTGTGTGDGGGGIYLIESNSDPTLTNVTIVNNTANAGGGIYRYDLDCEPTLVNTIIWNNIPNSYNIANGGSVTFSDIEGGFAGVGNINDDPLFLDMVSGDYSLTNHSPCIDSGDPDTDNDGSSWETDIDDQDPDGTRKDMGAYYYHHSTPIYLGPVWHVASDGSNESGNGSYDLPFASIQFGIDASANGDTVLVQPGTYFENINFNGMNIAVGSLTLTTGDTSYISSTIIDGNQVARVATFVTGEDSTAVLNGFTLFNGINSSTANPDLKGGGIYCENTSPTLSDLRILENTAHYGGGVYLENSSSRLLNLEITTNSALTDGGGLYLNNCTNVRVENCSVIDNTANTDGVGGNGYGGGVKCHQSNGSLINVTIGNNQAFQYGGGIYLDDSSPTLSDVYISDNSAANGGGIYILESAPYIVNTSVTNNIANGGGGGVSITSTSNPIIEDCFISGNSATTKGGGIWASGGQLTINNSIINNNTTEDDGGGIACHEGTILNIDSSEVRGNVAGLEGGGFYLHNNDSVRIVYTTISDNQATNNGGGIVLRGYNNDPYFQNLTITNNTASNTAEILDYANHSNYRNCIIWHSEGGGVEIDHQYAAEYCFMPSDVGGTNTGELGTIDNSDPEFAFPDTGNYNLLSSSSCIDAGDPDLDGDGNLWEIDPDDQDPDGTRMDIGAYYYHQTPAYEGPVWHISTEGSDEIGDGSEDSPFASIQVGIDATQNHDTVLVQPGTYVETINYNGKNIVLGSLRLISEDDSYISQTIIDGDQDGSVVTFGSGEDSTAVLLGFTIRNGGALNGGGVNCYNASPRVVNCSISGNTATSFGGGLFFDVNSKARIENSIVDNNDATLGGGIFCEINSDIKITDVIIRGNIATSLGGGFYCTEANPTFNRVLVEGNSANSFGGVYFHGTENTETFLNNVTIVGNTAVIGGGLISSHVNTILTVSNCIIWGNSPDQVYEELGSLSINYSDIQNGWEGIGNFDEDPLFVDAEVGNFHLESGSPCIDTGDPTSPLDPDDTRADMGAYYFDQIAHSPQISISPDSLNFTVNTAEGFEQSQTLTISNTGATALEATITINSYSVTDIDGNIYPTVQIGDQIWMAENLKVTHFRDGTAITNIIDAGVWETLTTEAYCVHDNNISNESETYGNLYNRYAAVDVRDIAPEGWHLPTDAEWKELEMALGMSQLEADAPYWRGTNEGSKLAGDTDLWANGALVNNSEFGTSGFTALPGGSHVSLFTNLGNNSYFWSATEDQPNNAWIRALNASVTNINRTTYNDFAGLSIRCVKDSVVYRVENSEKRSDDTHNGNYGIQNGADPNSESLRDTHDRWLTTAPTILTIQPGGDAEVTVTVTADGLELGDYSDIITITSNDPSSGTIEVPVTMSIIFQDLIPPDVQLNIPDSTEVVENGDTLTVTWSASDDVALDWAKLFFTSNGGASFSLYDSVDANLGELEWIAPDVISNSCNFAIWVSDLAGNVSADTLIGSFAIDDGTDPIISILNPTELTSVKEGDTLFVEWEASDNVGIEWFELWYSNKPSEPFQNVVQISGEDTTFAFGLDNSVSDSARIKMDVMDVAGNLAEDYSEYFSITDNTSPTISFFSIPDTTEWGIGTVMDISVIATDNVEVTGLDLNYSTDEGATWIPIVDDLYPVQGRPTYSWLIPDVPGDCQVRAVVTDEVGLTATAYSDVFSIFIEYPRLIASLAEIKPNGHLHLQFSQLMDSLDISTGAQVIGSVFGSYEIEGELSGYDATISTPDGFVSLDTLQLVLNSSAWTNRYGYGLDGNGDGAYDGNSIDNDTSYTMVNAAGDYDQNGVINFDDFDDFVIAWNNSVSSYELAPHQGVIPYVSIQPDSSFDIYDLATFASMWNWAAGISLAAPLTESYPFEEFISEQSGNDLEVSVPLSNYVASQTIIKYDPSVVQIMVADDGLAKVSSSGLSMVDVNPDSGFILITSSHLTDSNDDDLNLKLIPDTKQRYSIEIAIQGSDMDANVIQKRSLVELLPIPTSFSLSQNYPNPFNASTTIEYGLPKDSDLSISIYDIRGRFVRDIYSGENQAGYHVTHWNGHNDQGQNVASGLYFIVLHTPEYRMARKALILK